jgi:hypothetical protein
MTWTRREFVGTLLAGAVVLPLAGKSMASDLLPRPPSALPRDDLQLLDDLERAAFEFFWNEADPSTGLPRDRANADGGDDRNRGSIAAAGFGLTAMCIGHLRRYRSRDEIEARVRDTLSFLAHEAPHVRGFFYHFVDIETGARYGVSELSPIDMAILLCGVLTCRQYFSDPGIRRDATEIYQRVDWPWALNGGNTFALDWVPELGFSSLRWDAYCESLMLYLLAMGSPTHPIAAECWHAIRRPLMVYENFRFISTPAPLFIHQFSHAWVDFRNKRDDYADYFLNSVTASLAHRHFCEQLGEKFPCYSKELWGITASDSSSGYVVWGGPPQQGPIDGTIVPAAAAGSLAFISREALAVIRTLRAYDAKPIWKRYGFVDAFNPLSGWASADVIGIDLGIGMLMAENLRSQFVWNTFMRNRELPLAMARAGFQPRRTRYPA